jgi:hypothetical protein
VMVDHVTFFIGERTARHRQIVQLTAIVFVLRTFI